MASNMDTMDLDDDDRALDAQAAEISALPDIAREDDMQDADGVEEGEVASTEPVTTKIFVEISNDALTTMDLTNFAQDAYYSDDFQRVEWINDTSAKLAYASADAATDALDKLSAEPAASPLDLRRAVGLATHPHVELFLRQAVVTDMKKSGAASQSKFYEIYPAYRPDHSHRGRGPRRGGFGRGGPRGGGRQRGNGRPISREGPHFDEILYDDDEEALAARRKLQEKQEAERKAERDDLFEGRRRETRRQQEDLMAGRTTGRLRDRSASPLRDSDGDGRFGFSEDQPQRQKARQRSPPRRRSREDNEDLRQSMRQDLFAGKKTSTALTNGNNNPTELFPGKASRGNDLFQQKVDQKYQDADDREATRAFGGFNMRNQSAPGSYQPASRNNTNGAGKRDLFDRINGGLGAASKGTHGRLSDDHDGGFSFKGQSGGYSIRGASQDTGGGNDLFPNKKKARDTQRFQGDSY
ncbi:hypothetical protein PRZ48_012105 [Zasmidium cellare]|uniref:Uncharacterized protein n=1 Tax=Zasmidium cellare TaxID=395010 RepID=A0ABR0E3X1_ZASCE|nr:hypothetical protein PRZ48_012105 [Zasmidium cellare]